MASLKEAVRKPTPLTGGHGLCPGCAESVLVRQVIMASDKPVVVSNATGCLEVCTTTFPYTAWTVPWIHCAFETAASTMSGVEAAYEAAKRRGTLNEDINFVAIAGDGGTYDIGFQALSGALERGHRMVYLCLNNEAYMNTGTQRSSATPIGTYTTTTPVGDVWQGKLEHRKDLTAIVAAHNIPYVAQIIPGRPSDTLKRAEKAFAVKGPAFLNALSPCQRGWRYDVAQTLELTRLAVNTCFWPLYEVENGVWRLNYKPKEKVPMTEYLRPQARFRHLFKPENEHVLQALQAQVDRDWERLLRMCDATA